jgi:hypothetical protein
MAIVPPGYGEYLKSPARYVGATIVGSAAWGDMAVDSVVVSPLALKEHAQAEATAQAQFLAGPHARDRILVRGLWADYVGRIARITGNRLGYENGANVMILGATESESVATTVLLVLKRLYE